MIDLAGLDERFARLAGEYELRWAAAQDAVVRWEWYDDEAFDLRPLHFERRLSRPGCRLVERPDAGRDHVRLGFDAEGRRVVMLEYSGFLGGRLCYGTFRSYHPGGAVEEAHFHADGRPIYLHEYRFEAGVIRSAAMAAVSGGGWESYEYTDGRVTRLATHHGERQGGVLRPPAFFEAVDAGYDDQGLLRLETSAPGGPAEVTYERPPVGFTVEDAWRTVRQELLSGIPRAVRALAIDAPAYCVALRYEDPADPAGFTVHVGMEEDRRADLDEIWSPAEMAHETWVDLGPVAGTARLLAQELALSGSELGRYWLRELAGALGAADWSAVLPVTGDFVVFAVDVEMAHLD